MASISRRDILKTAALGAAGVAASTVAGHSTESETMAEALAPAQQGKSMIGVAFEPRDLVKVGFIGVGGRGTGLLDDLLNIPGVRVTAICDLNRERVVRAQKMVMNAGMPEPTGYWRNERDFENLNAREDLDLVIIATPWNWHTPMAVDAMKKGKHVGLEVPSAQTIKECWQLVDTSEATQRHCMMMENCNYGGNEMLVWNMVHKGMLGTITHGEAAYIHDLRSLLMGDGGEGVWRWIPHVERDGNFYPTHGLGPVGFYMDLNRGDRFESMVSFSSMEAALSEYVEKNPPTDERKRKAKYKGGDMNSSVIRTAMGRTIMLQHDVVTPRPYSRLNLVQGTKGCFSDYPARLALDSVDGAHRWLKPEEYEPIKAEHQHPIIKQVNDELGGKGGHGGMDLVMLYRIIHCMRKGLTPDIDVYDLAAIAAPGPLSEASVKKGGAPQKFPDFTRGRWKEKRDTYLP